MGDEAAVTGTETGTCSLHSERVKEIQRAYDVDRTTRCQLTTMRN